MISWKDFARNEWKSVARSPIAGQMIATRILWAVIIFVVSMQFIAVGAYLPTILRKEYHGVDPLAAINSFLWVYFIFDIILRLIITTIPSTVARQYLPLNIGRKTIANYLVVKSTFNLANAIGIVLWLSFSCSYFTSFLPGFLWFAGIIVILSFNNLIFLFLATLRQLSVSIMVVFLAGGIFYLLQHFNFFSFNEGAAFFFNGLADMQYRALLILSFFLATFAWFVRERITGVLYGSDEANVLSKKYSVSETAGLRFEWLLMWRNKRLRTMMFGLYCFLAPSFLLQVIVFQSNPKTSFGYLMPFMMLNFYFMTICSMWSQLTFMTESTFFDLLYTLKGFLKLYLRKKFFFQCVLLLAAFCVATVAGIVFFKKPLLGTMVALCIFHGGTTAFLALFRATFHRKRFEINTSAWFNYQGSSFSIVDILIFINAFAAPALYYAFLKLGWTSAVVPFFGLVGAIGLVFYKHLLDMIYRSFHKWRYSMLEGFRTLV